MFSDGTSGCRFSRSTGGYIIGFIIAAFVVGWLTERGLDRNPITATVAMFCGNVALYIPAFSGWITSSRAKHGVRLLPVILGDFAKLLLGRASSRWLGVLRNFPATGRRSRAER